MTIFSLMASAAPPPNNQGGGSSTSGATSQDCPPDVKSESSDSSIKTIWQKVGGVETDFRKGGTATDNTSAVRPPSTPRKFYFCIFHFTMVDSFINIYCKFWSISLIWSLNFRITHSIFV